MDRSKLSDPAASLKRGGEHDVGLAAVMFVEIPDRFSVTESPEAYESFVEHVPEVGNEAHCHLKVQKEGYSPGEVWNKKKPKSKVFRRRIKEDIAEQFKVVLVGSA